MYFRFASGLVLVILVSVAGVAVEKRCLALRRALSRQQYRADALREVYAQIRLKTQQLGAPVRLIEAIEGGRLRIARRDRADETPEGRLPLLSWQRSDRGK